MAGPGVVVADDAELFTPKVKIDRMIANSENDFIGLYRSRLTLVSNAPDGASPSDLENYLMSNSGRKV